MFSFLASRRNRSRQLDGYLTRYLAGTYGMDKGETDTLMFTQSGQKIADRTVKLFRIYKPELTKSSADPITYAGLDGYPDAIVFEGRYASNGTVTEIKDLRPTPA